MHTQNLWMGVAGGMAFIVGSMPVAQAVETVDPYAPQPLPAQPNKMSPTMASIPPISGDIGISFDLPHAADFPPATSPQVIAARGLIPLIFPPEWWNMGSNSPIAIAIGMAEGTRTLDGSKTPAYYWHSDPGNGASNFGTFSYQHLPPHQITEVDRQSSPTAKREVSQEAGLPELSDRLQLQRLQRFSQQLQQQAQQRGIALNLLEVLNGLDLANQSEAAALSPLGYIDRLVQMRSLLPGQGEEQIQEARVWAYWSPDRHSWDAPGLGNHYESIRRDQSRRFAAVKKALQTYAQAALPIQTAPPGSSPAFSPLSAPEAEARVQAILSFRG